MEFFIDTADVNEIKELASSGLVDGVTTNPSLIARSGRDFHKVIAEICEIIKGPVSAEVIATDRDNMIKEGKVLAKIAENVCIKLPLTWEGLQACKYFSDEGIQTNVTLCFSPGQALLAAKAGATYVSPFIGRLDDISSDGLKLIEDILLIYNNYADLSTKVLVASVRNPMQVIASAQMGADTITLPPKILKQLVSHPLTDMGLEAFLRDWNHPSNKPFVE
jgi:transaldolase